MEVVRKLRVFLAAPRENAWWAAHCVGEILLLVRQARLGALVGYLVAGLTGRRIYDRYIDRLASRSDGTVTREIRDHRMELDLEDAGLSRDLFLYGVREQRGTAIFERELTRLGSRGEAGVVLEVGANIGYFALMELHALEADAELVAFEPDPRNRELLERNLERNGYRDRATVEDAAIASDRGTATLELSDHSNLNRLRTENGDWEWGTGETVSVETWSVDAYLAAHDRDPEGVIAARMDIEGHEVAAIQGMESVLAAPGPLVLSLEVHTGQVDAADLQWMVDEFAAHDLEVVAMVNENVTAWPLLGERVVDDVTDLPIQGPAYNVILRKPPECETNPDPASVDASTE